MPLRELTPLPGSSICELISAEAVPYVLSRLCQTRPEAALPVSVLERGPKDSHSVAAALEALVDAGALRFGEVGCSRTVAVTPLGARLVLAYRAWVAWASSVTIEPCATGSERSWEMIIDASSAWTQGVILLLTGRTATTSEIALALGRDPAGAESLLTRLADRGLVTRLERRSPSWVLLKDGKRTVSPLARTLLAGRSFDPSPIEEAIKPGHAEAISRLCLESISSSVEGPRLHGAHAIVMKLPGGRLAGCVAEFGEGDAYSFHPYRPGIQVDGGIRGSVDACLRLIADGNARRMSSFGPNHRSGVRLAKAISLAAAAGF